MATPPQPPNPDDGNEIAIDHSVQGGLQNKSHSTGPGDKKADTCGKDLTNLFSLQYFLVILAIGASLTFATSDYLPNEDCNKSLLESGKPNTYTNSTNCTMANLLEDYMNVYMSILLIIAVGGFVVCTVYHSKIICTGRRNVPKQTEIPYWHYGTIIFGVGALVWFILRLLGDATGGTSFITGDIYNALQIAFILGQIFFVFSVSDVDLESSQLMTVFLMHVAATTCCLWILITVGEAQERKSKLTARCSQTAFATVCVRNYNVPDFYNIQDFGSGSSDSKSSHDELTKIIHRATPFLYPCIAEFCLSASGLILKLWLNQQSQSADHQKPQIADQAAVANPDDNGDDNQLLLRASRQQRTRRCSRLCRYATVFAIIFLPFTLVAIIWHIVDDTNNHNDQNSKFQLPTVLYEVIQVVVISTALITAIIGLISDGKTCDPPANDPPANDPPANDLPANDPPANDPPAGNPAAEQEPQNTKGSHTMVEGALFLISVSGLYFAQCLQLNASLNSKYTNNMLHIPHNKTSCHTMLNLSSAQSFLTAGLAFFQTLFIMQGLTSKVYAGKINQQHTPADGGRNPAGRSKSDDTCICDLTPADRRGTAALVLFICNLTLWISKTYEMSGLYCNPLYSDFYSSWVQLSDVFYPLWIFYHFHSAATCVNIAWNSFK